MPPTSQQIQATWTVLVSTLGLCIQMSSRLAGRWKCVAKTTTTTTTSTREPQQCEWLFNMVLLTWSFGFIIIIVVVVFVVVCRPSLGHFAAAARGECLCSGKSMFMLVSFAGQTTGTRNDTRHHSIRANSNELQLPDERHIAG